MVTALTHLSWYPPPPPVQKRELDLRPLASSQIPSAAARPTASLSSPSPFNHQPNLLNNAGVFFSKHTVPVSIFLSSCLVLVNALRVLCSL